MIKNERQYRITNVQLAKFQAAVDLMRQQQKPANISDRLWRAQIDAVQSQYEDLAREVREYESLQAARPATIDASSLDDLPRALIRARIALDLSQKALAERMGIKEQQIQRYEATEYESATLSRLKELAQALGVRVSEKLFLPQVTQSKSNLLERLEGVGVSSEFLVDKLLPSDIADVFRAAHAESESVVVSRTSDVLKRIYDWDPIHLLGIEALHIPEKATATARFKIPAGAGGIRLNAYVAYAYYLATVIANASENLPKRVPTTDIGEVRNELLKRDDEISLRALLNFLWDMGIPVLSLRDSGAFHGACWRINGRNVIVVKQRSKYTSRWLFDLLHETYHATRNPNDPTYSWIEEDELSEERRTSVEEQDANRFAGDVLLDGRAEELIDQCVKLANGNVRNFKAVVPKVAQLGKVNVGNLANYMAYRLSLQAFNWWGAASNLQEVGEDPYEIVRDVFMRRFDFGKIEQLDAKILHRALALKDDHDD